MDAHYVIPLTKGKQALVSPEDFERVSQFKWCASGKYAARHIDGNRTQSMHRFILEITDSRVYVDHIDGNGLNNTRENIRILPQSINVHRGNRKRASSSGFYGVSRHESGWQVHARLLGSPRTFIGLFKDPLDGAVAYDLAVLNAYGDEATTNFRWQKKEGRWTRLF